MIKKILPGDTFEYQWISSGTLPSSASYEVFNNLEVVVNTGTLISSGNGHYYEKYTVPSSEGYYVFKSTITISAKQYIRSRRFEVIELEVD